VHAAGADAPTKLLGESLGIGARAVQLIRVIPSDPRLVRAVRIQALLRATPASCANVA